MSTIIQKIIKYSNQRNWGLTAFILFDADFPFYIPSVISGLDTRRVIDVIKFSTCSIENNAGTGYMRARSLTNRKCS